MSSPTIAILNQRLSRAQAALASARHNLNSMQQNYTETMAMQGLELANISRSILAGESNQEGARVALVDVMFSVRIQWLFLIENQRRNVEMWKGTVDQLVEMRDRELGVSFWYQHMKPVWSFGILVLR